MAILQVVKRNFYESEIKDRDFRVVDVVIQR